MTPMLLALPERRAPQRARVIFDFVEHLPSGPVQVHTADTGWAMIDGPWVWWFSDEDDDAWRCYPIQSIIVVEWERS